MVWVEEYPPNFKALREIEKYDPKQDLAVCINTYLMTMGIAGHTKLLATRYLPLLVDKNTRQWLNTLPKNSIDSRDEMRSEFVNYSRTTSIEDLMKCIQRSKESTRKWLHR
jgi:NAD-dependent SIR2 family protein deacetylase